MAGVGVFAGPSRARRDLLGARRLDPSHTAVREPASLLGEVASRRNEFIGGRLPRERKLPRESDVGAVLSCPLSSVFGGEGEGEGEGVLLGLRVLG